MFFRPLLFCPDPFCADFNPVLLSASARFPVRAGNLSHSPVTISSPLSPSYQNHPLGSLCIILAALKNLAFSCFNGGP